MLSWSDRHVTRRSRGREVQISRTSSFSFESALLNRRNMLGKRPCVLRTSCSSSLLISGDDADEKPATLWKISQVTDKSPSPAVSAPCKIVVGFDVGGKKKPTLEACGSPRSVLEPLALAPSQEKQHIVARSSRSGLGNLLAAESEYGGRAVGDQIYSEEMVTRVGSFVAGSCKATFCARETCSDEMCLSVNWSHCGPKEAVRFGDALNLNFMDGDVFSGQRKACVRDEHLDADISPQRTQRLCHSMSVPLGQDMIVDLLDASQKGAANAHSRVGLKDKCLNDEMHSQCGHASWRVGEGYATPKFIANKENAEIHLSPRKTGPSLLPGRSDCKYAGITLQPTHFSRRTSLDMEECTGDTVLSSIFSAGSPPPCPHSLNTSSSGFLKMCAYCGHSLQLGKDVFMYRGDQGFCSAECRYQKIVSDEGKNKSGS